MKTKLEKLAGNNTITPPLTAEDLEVMEPCGLADVMVGNPHGLAAPDMSLAGYQKQLMEVLQVRLKVVNGMFPYQVAEKYWPFKFEMPRQLPAPLKEVPIRQGEYVELSFDRPAGLAQIVEMDDPEDFVKAICGWLNRKGTPIKDDSKFTDFGKRHIYPKEDALDGLKTAWRKCFEAKYHFMAMRPEGVLEVLSDNLGFKIDGTLLTAYENGCPPHFEFPQGHNSLATESTMRAIKHYELTEVEMQEILSACFFWGYFRVMAGVHFGASIIAGLLIGGCHKKYFKKEVYEKYTA